MYEEFVPERLAKLRLQKGVSARDMSLSLGQANNYINNIENKKSLPAMKKIFIQRPCRNLLQKQRNWIPN